MKNSDSLGQFATLHWQYTYYVPFGISLPVKRNLVKNFMRQFKGDYEHENYGIDKSFILHSGIRNESFSLYIETTDSEGHEHYYEQYQVLELVYFQNKATV